MTERIRREQREKLRSCAMIDVRMDRNCVIDPGVINDLLDDLVDLKAENAALGQWQCAECGCRFNDPANPADLDGVTRCTPCVTVEQQAREIDELRELLTFTETPKEPETRRIRVTVDLDLELEGPPISIGQTISAAEKTILWAFKDRSAWEENCKVDLLAAHARSVESLTETQPCP